MTENYWYERSQIGRVLADGPGKDEDSYRIKITGESDSKWLRVTETQLRALMDAAFPVSGD